MQTGLSVGGWLNYFPAYIYTIYIYDTILLYTYYIIRGGFFRHFLLKIIILYFIRIYIFIERRRRAVSTRRPRSFTPTASATAY